MEGEGCSFTELKPLFEGIFMVRKRKRKLHFGEKLFLKPRASAERTHREVRKKRKGFGSNGFGPSWCTDGQAAAQRHPTKERQSEDEGLDGRDRDDDELSRGGPNTGRQWAEKTDGRSRCLVPNGRTEP